MKETALRYSGKLLAEASSDEVVDGEKNLLRVVLKNLCIEWLYNVNVKKLEIHEMSEFRWV
jgi:hypothetical protein